MRTPPARTRRRNSRERTLENAGGARFGVDSHVVRVVSTAVPTAVRVVSTSASELAVNRSVNAVASLLP
jgi:hypothetical protein